MMAASKPAVLRSSNSSKPRRYQCLLIDDSWMQRSTRLFIMIGTTHSIAGPRAAILFLPGCERHSKAVRREVDLQVRHEPRPIGLDCCLCLQGRAAFSSPASPGLRRRQQSGVIPGTFPWKLLPRRSRSQLWRVAEPPFPALRGPIPLHGSCQGPHRTPSDITATR